MKNVLCLLPVEQRHKDKLERAGEGCEFVYVTESTVTEEQIAAANVIVGCPPANMIKGSENLELLQTSSAGVDPYIKAGVLNEKTQLTNATGAFSQTVAEHGLAGTLMLQKKLHLYRDSQKKGEWSEHGLVSSISDSTVLVVGLGDIGCYYARLVKALGAYVIGVKRRPSAKPDCVDELYTMESLKELLPRADVVFSILPGTAATYHLYTAELFDLMKPSAIFLNLGRGGAVAADVLYEAISEKKIAAATIDVTEPEPLPADHPLWKLDNLLITPHVSGFYHLPVTFERVIDIAAYNLEHYLKGEELKNIVDFETGYKK